MDFIVSLETIVLKLHWYKSEEYLRPSWTHTKELFTKSANGFY